MVAWLAAAIYQMRQYIGRRIPHHRIRMSLRHRLIRVNADDECARVLRDADEARSGFDYARRADDDEHFGFARGGACAFELSLRQRFAKPHYAGAELAVAVIATGWCEAATTFGFVGDCFDQCGIRRSRAREAAWR